MTTPRGISDPDLPGSPYYNKPIPPKSAPGGKSGPAPFVADTIADQAVPLPIVYGTMKVPLKLIEKFAPIVGDPPAWTTTTQWAAGAFCSSNGNAYKTPGNSTGTHTGGLSGASAPTHTAGTVSDGGMDWTYVQQLPCPVYTQVFVAALCEGPIEGESGLWWDKEKLATVAAKGLVLHTGPDAANQSLASESASYDSSGYQHTALVDASVTPQLNCFTGTQAELPDAAVETIGIRFGATSADASPADVVNDMLTSFRRGAGWPTSRVHSSVSGTAAGDYRVYCDAAGLRFSVLMDSQRPALAWLADYLQATNSDAVWSQGQLKVKPLADTAIPTPVYGATGYVPANAAVYNLSTDDFLDREQPVSYDTADDADTFNRWPVQYIDRQLGYVQTTVDFPDQANADLLGVRDSGTVNLPVCFPDGTQATLLSKILAQRSNRVTVTYRFRVDWRYILLDPTDVVTLTESLTGLLGESVRLTDLEEQDDGSLVFTAESYPAGVAAATGYQPQTGSGYVSNDVVTTQVIPTSIDGVRSGITDGIVTAAAGTRSGHSDNLFPNPTSESDPPAGANTARTEWAGRLNAGVEAYAGAWVRQISTAIHAPVLLGDRQASPVADQSQLGCLLPCAPGDQFYIESRLRFRDAAAGESAGVFTWFLDANGALVGNASSFVSATAPTFADTGSLVSNGGGETGTLGAQATGWTLGGGNGLLVANDFAHSGTKSLKITNGTAADSFSSEDMTVVGGQEYLLSGWIKTTALPTADAGVGAFFNIDAQSGVTSFTVNEKLTVGADPNAAQPDCGIAADGTAHDWTFVRSRFVPNASGTIRLYCQLGYLGAQSGTAWFDEVTVTPVFKVTAFGTAPIGATKVLIGLWANCASGAMTAWFDAIYARRADLAPLDHARTTISPYALSSGWERLLKALDGEASTTGTAQSGLAWYRGNIDPTDPSSGKPIIWDSANGDRVTLTVFGSCGNVSISSAANWAQAIPLQITIQPKTNQDNLDAIRVISLKFYSGAGTFREEIRIPLTDRAYGSAGSPTNALNALVIRQAVIVPGAQGDFAAGAPNHFNGFIRVTLYGAYGFSDARDFANDGNLAGANMGGGATIPGVGGATGTGGGGSNYCPAPEALILMEDGSAMPAGELRDGMRVQGFLNNDFATPLIGTVRYAAPERALSRYLLTFADGRAMRFSKNHQIYSATRGAWLAVQYLQPGEEIHGQATCIVEGVTEDGPGPVMGFSVEGTHTYFADGVLCHNSKASIP